MKQYIRNNYLAAFDGTDKDTANLSGGVAVWDTPAQVMCAYNPIIFTRTKYLYRTARYIPTQESQPNYCLIDYQSSRATFQFETEDNFFMVFSDQHETLTYEIERGTTEVNISGATARQMLFVGFNRYDDEGGEILPFLECGNGFIYVCEGYNYTDEDFLCKGSTGEVMYRDTATVQTVTFDVYRSNSVYRTLSAESYKGKVRFDVSSLVRKWMSASLASIPAGKALVSDKALSVRFFVKGIGGYNTQYTYLAVNAVAQTGEYSDRTSYIGKVLTEFPSLRCYDGYELDYSVLAGSQAVTTERGEVPSMSVSRIRVQETSSYLADGDDNAVLDQADHLITMLPKFDIPVFGRCLPATPFYVRWVNRLGGVDYWMFARTQKRSPQVKSVSTFAPYVDDTGASRTNALPYALTTDNTVTAGASDLSAEEYAALENIPFAPIIEHYDEGLGKWIRLTVAKFTGDDQRDAARKEIEITFTLPTINTQF